jgi:hypothetical protein
MPIMPFKKYRTIIEIFWFWFFPIGVFYFTQPYFAQQFGQTFAYFMLFFPAITMYLVVGTGAGYCKFWYFTTSYSPQGVMLTIGLLYSAVANFSCYFVGLVIPQENWWFFIPFVGVLNAALATFIDVFLLGSGLFYLKSKTYPLGSDPVKHAISYGKYFFTIVGMWNATGLLIGKALLQNGSSLAVLLCIMPPLFALPFMIRFLSQYFALKKKGLVYRGR